MADEMPAVNWNVHNIQDVRDHWVKINDGRIALVKFYCGCWAVGPHEGMDIWSACAVLNNMGARKWAAYDITAPKPDLTLYSLAVPAALLQEPPDKNKAYAQPLKPRKRLAKELSTEHQEHMRRRLRAPAYPSDAE